jgi:hypothetical protein
MMAYWNIFVRDCNGVVWGHRIYFDRHQFWGIENLYRVFPPNQWTVFLHKLFTDNTGSVTITRADGETNVINWIKE